jgi:hypothetical protein
MEKSISDYLDAVCAPIHSKVVSAAARAELTDHLAERCREFAEQGLDEADAARQALSLMGDPETLGRRIAAANRPYQSLLTLLGGTALIAAGLFLAVWWGGGINPLSLYDLGSLVAVIILSGGYGLMVCRGKPTWPVFLRGVRTGALYAAVLLTVTSCIMILEKLDNVDTLGPAIAVAVMSLFYGIVLSMAARVAEHRVTPPEPGSILRQLTTNS